MPTSFQFRRGTTTQNNAFTGAAGELSVDTDKNTLRVHDNSTAGGTELMLADASNATNDPTITLTGAVTGSGTMTNLGSVSIATTATADPTLTLTGDASGSATFTNLGNATLTVAVADDSHNHSSSTGGFTVGGDLTVSGGDITLSGTGRIQGIDTVTAGTDAANKTYVDSAISSLSSTTLTEGNSNVTVADSGTGTFTVTLDGATHTTFNSSGITLATGNFVGTATEAQYADLAEKYTSDEEYEAGTVVMFGGEAEITMAMGDMNPRVAGVISTDPAYMMNSEAEGQYVALTGRVPCKVMGQVRKGDMMVSAGNGMARSEEEPKMGTVIGKALEDFDGDEGVIEVVVGRM